MKLSPLNRPAVLSFHSDMALPSAVFLAASQGDPRHTAILERLVQHAVSPDLIGLALAIHEVLGGQTFNPKPQKLP